jgi:hypothetical protein
VDLMVRNLEESAFAGDNIFNTTGENQSRMQQGGAGKKFTYLLRIQNDSDGTDTLLVKQDATSVASLGWTVKYYDSPTGGYDITGMITSAAGWVLAARQPGSVRDIRVEVTANTTVPADAMANLLLTVSSLGDPAKVDAVLCTAKKLKLTSVSFIVSPAGSASPGMPVTLVATAVGGNTVEYRFAVRHKDPNTGGQVWDNAYTRMFSVKNTVTWTFSAPQTYTFVVYARELGTTGAEQYAITSIQSYGITSVP